MSEKIEVLKEFRNWLYEEFKGDVKLREEAQDSSVIAHYESRLDFSTQIEKHLEEMMSKIRDSEQN